MSKDKENENNKNIQAATLAYDGITIPKVTAQGEDELAEKILNLAKEHNIPICQNSELIKLLMLLETGEDIPEQIYIAVATIIAFVYQLEGNHCQ